MLRRQLMHPVEREHRLRVERMRYPQRAVLIEGSDPILGRHEVGARRVGGRAHEGDDRLFGRAVVPRRKRIIRRLGRNDVPSGSKDNHERTNLTLSAKSHCKKAPPVAWGATRGAESPCDSMLPPVVRNALDHATAIS